MIEKIKSFISEWNLISKDDKIAVAFSGGADSVVLLDFIYHEYKNLSAIHINHMIRGEEAERDEKFARDFCTERGIELFTVKINLPKLKKSGESLEEAARRLRYAEFEKYAERNAIDVILTAHHADDNAETLIFNLCRGSGGIKGVPPIRGIYKRPLLCVTKKEILAYCEENNLPYVTDSTNFDTDYTRNFIRQEILPKLREINPDVSSAFMRACTLSSKESDYLDLIAENALKLSRGELAKEDGVIINRAIRLMLKKAGVDAGSRVVDSVKKSICDGNNYHCVNVGGGKVFVCDRDDYFIREQGCTNDGFNLHLNYGINNCEGFDVFYTDDFRKAEKWIDEYHITKYTFLYKNQINGEIFVRSKKDGDRYSYRNMTHKVKKLFCERNIPVEKRNSVALFCDGDGIIWIDGFLPSSRFEKPDISKDRDNIIFLGIQYKEIL